MKGRLILLLVVLLGVAINVTQAENNAYSQNTPDIEIKTTLDRKSYEPREPIRIVCEIRNVSRSTLWLPPLQVIDVHFSMYRDNVELLPFGRPSMPFYEGGYIELLPGQAHIFERILDKNTYYIPSHAGEYRLCVNYENNKKSMGNIDLWVGKISSCVPLKIEERQ